MPPMPAPMMMMCAMKCAPAVNDLEPGDQGQAR
jgi:hypothetical protein